MRCFVSRKRRGTEPQATLRPGTTVAGLTAQSLRGLGASIFICDQSYGNSRPQSRQTTYVPVTEAATVVRRSSPRTVMGKLHRLCQQPKTTSNRLIESFPIEAGIHADRRGLSPFREGESPYPDRAVFRGPSQVALSATAAPVPTASTKQKHNHNDDQNRFYAHIDVL